MKQLRAIFVNAGHGIGPSGNVDNGASGIVQERPEVVQIANELCIELAKRPEFKGAMIWRIGVDEAISLLDMIASVNDIMKRKDYAPEECICVSVHANANGGTGIETLYKEGDADGRRLAKSIGAYLSLATELPNRGVKADTTTSHGRLGIIRDVKCDLSVLVECGFVDNAVDAAKLKDEKEDDKFSIGIADGLAEFVRGEYEGEPRIFPDVEVGRWSEEAIKFCKEKGYMTGYAHDGTFRPTQPISREELAHVVYKIKTL